MRPPDTTYCGLRHVGPAGEVLGTEVTVNGRPLLIDPSRQVRDHSPTGFEWGYGGSGPSQLALALLLDATGGDRDLSTRCYHWFKWATVSGWGDTWRITAGEIHGWLDRWEREDRERELSSATIAAFDVPTVEGGEA